MSYRTFVGAGAAVALTAASALALPQQQPRPGLTQNQGASQAKQLLEDLEGSWDVDVHVWSMEDARRESGQQPGQAPGMTGQANTQQIERQIQQAMTQAGVSEQEARQHAQRLARQFAQQRPEQQQIQQQLEQAMTQAGVDRQQAQQQAQRLSQQIHRQVQQGGERPGQSGQSGQSGQASTQQLEQQIQQAMTQAGVSQQEARQHAQRLARQFAQQRPEQQQIQQQLEQAMTQAGVDRQQAQQQAQRLSQQIHRQIQQGGDRPGIRPGDDDTNSPLYDTDDRSRDRAQSQEYNNATLRAEGSSTREWVLDENILEEEVDFSMASEAPTDRPGQSPSFNRNAEKAIQMLQDGETLEGRGMFGFDEESGNLYHVWADSSQGKIFFSVGEYNEREKTVTFRTADAREIMRNGSSPSRPGIRPGQTRPTQPGSRPGQPTRPGTPGGEPGASLISQQQGQSPSQGQGQSDDGPRVVLRILDDNEHVVEYYRTDSPGGNAVRTMVVTYSRN